MFLDHCCWTCFGFALQCKGLSLTWFLWIPRRYVFTLHIIYCLCVYSVIITLTLYGTFCSRCKWQSLGGLAKNGVLVRRIIGNGELKLLSPWSISQKWRSKDSKAEKEEIHFLKLLFRCAPMLQTLTLKLSKEVTDDWYNIFLDTVQEYPYVNSSVCISVD